MALLSGWILPSSKKGYINESWLLAYSNALPMAPLVNTFLCWVSTHSLKAS
jgi:hypothetical protein